MSGEKLELGCTPLARIVAYANHAQEPEWFDRSGKSIADTQKAGLEAKDIDLYEINEAFSVVSLVTNQRAGPESGAREYPRRCGGMAIRSERQEIEFTTTQRLESTEQETEGTSLCIGEKLSHLVERISELC